MLKGRPLLTSILGGILSGLAVAGILYGLKYVSLRTSSFPDLGSFYDKIKGDPLIAGFVSAVLAGFVLHLATSKKRKAPVQPAGPPEEIKPPETPLAQVQPKLALVPDEENSKKIWNVPHAPTRFFTGREQLLADLRDTLTSGEPTALTQAIAGLGGVGKTQLALKYCHDHRESYEVVWWVRAETPDTLKADYAELASVKGLVEPGETDRSVKVAATRHWLQSERNWLLVLDNAEGPEAVKDYLPPVGMGHVIITSRNQTWGQTAQPLPVDMMKPEEAVKLLLTRSGQEDSTTAAELAKALGYFPLALEQAGAYMDASGQTLEGYLALFHETCKKMLEDSQGCEDSHETVATTWDISFEKIKECAPAVELLNLTAFLDPDRIPLEILAEGAKHLPKVLKQAAKDGKKLDNAVTELRHYSLLEREKNYLNVHRLVQEVLRQRLTPAKRKTWAKRACKLMNDIFPFDWDAPVTWKPAATLLPHAWAAAGHAARQEVAVDTAARLYNSIGCSLRRQAAFSEARDAHGEALRLAEHEFGKEHEDVGVYANNLGSVLRAKGKFEEAKAYLERALEIDEQIYGQDHPEVAIDVNNLGGVLEDMGKLPEAKAHYERALKISEKTLGLEHPTVAIRVNNLGNVLRAMGKLTEAKAHYERALSIDERTYGPDHPEVATIVCNLGLVLYKMGDLEGARENSERALKIFSKFLGEEHPHTIISRESLEQVMKELGR